TLYKTLENIDSLYKLIKNLLKMKDSFTGNVNFHLYKLIDAHQLPTNFKNLCHSYLSLEAKLVV
ncbi:hypothetical protein, partial [Liquorilactobacillus nagelii]|uniref:hypothetical protein n=1 Tax=Liquorilactobacillus nagelii TaxID=82688 RepID=UPI0039EAC29A